MTSTESDEPCWLLLLPPTSPNISMDYLRAAYGPALASTLHKASQFASISESPPIALDISLACGSSFVSNDYGEVQRILGLMYTLLCMISLESIDLQNGDDVDTRVLILGTGQVEAEDAVGTNTGLQHDSIHLRALARSRRRWTRLYFIQSESGEAVFADFLRARHVAHDSQQADVEGLPGGSILNQRVNTSFPAAVSSQLPLHSHDSVAVGGTFDHLHAGHKLLLTITALLINFRDEPRREKLITIGISGDALLQKKQYVDQMLSWDARQTDVRKFMLGILAISQPAERLKTTRRIRSESDARSTYDEFESGLVIRYAEIFDPYGPTVTDKSISALVISCETRAGGRAVNEKREANGWPLLQIFEVDVLDAQGRTDEVGKEDFQGKISSTDIRQRLHENSASSSPIESKNRQDGSEKASMS